MIGYTKEQSSKKTPKQKKEKTNRYKCSICGEHYRMTSREYQLKGSVHSGSLKRSCEKQECKRQSILNAAVKEVEKQRKEARKMWKEKKAKLRSELNPKINHSQDALQVAINKIVRLIDKGKPCLARPFLNYKDLDAGHVFAVGSHPALRYHLWNIFGQSQKSNRFLGGEQGLMFEGIERRYGINRLEYVKDLVKEYPTLKLTFDEKKEALKIANKIIREWEWNPMTRDEVNKQIGIYE